MGSRALPLGGGLHKRPNGHLQQPASVQDHSSIHLFVYLAAACKCTRAAGPAGENCPAEEGELCRRCCPAGELFSSR